MTSTVLAIQGDIKTNDRGIITLEDWRKVWIEYILELDRIHPRTKQSERQESLTAGITVHSHGWCIVSLSY
jgi:hypothetical protein